MQILMINPPHSSIGSRIPNEHLPPLSLLSLGGPLIDAGHCVEMIDADLTDMSTSEITTLAVKYAPDVILLGHSGSSSAHPKVCEITRKIRQALPFVIIIYGGIFPTFHWKEILMEEPQIDYIVRGEGEEIIVQLTEAIENQSSVYDVKGIVFRDGDQVIATEEATLIVNLDDYRIGWELIHFEDYSYWGNLRAVVVQFSRGCPHKCSYCGQTLFWKKWRHRDPVKFALELARLAREEGVKVINFADENPLVSKEAWKTFLITLIEQNVSLKLVASARADDIVRDADIMHLYKKAGFERFLMGIENYDENILRQIKKGGSTNKDREAIQILRKHNIISMATCATGFGEEKFTDYLRTLKHLLSYDPDQIQMIYATPHKWTPFYNEAGGRRVIQTDKTKWDYKHQVLASKNLAPWLVLFCVKLIEIVMQLRPRSLMRYLFHPDLSIRRAIHWYYKIGRRVWFYEIWQFIFNETHTVNGPELAEFINPKKIKNKKIASGRYSCFNLKGVTA